MIQDSGLGVRSQIREILIIVIGVVAGHGHVDAISGPVDHLIVVERCAMNRQGIRGIEVIHAFDQEFPEPRISVGIWIPVANLTKIDIHFVYIISDLNQLGTCLLFEGDRFPGNHRDLNSIHCHQLVPDNFFIGFGPGRVYRHLNRIRFGDDRIRIQRHVASCFDHQIIDR